MGIAGASIVVALAVIVILVVIPSRSTPTFTFPLPTNLGSFPAPGSPFPGGTIPSPGGDGPAPGPSIDPSGWPVAYSGTFAPGGLSWTPAPAGDHLTSLAQSSGSQLTVSGDVMYTRMAPVPVPYQAVSGTIVGTPATVFPIDGGLGLECRSTGGSSPVAYDFLIMGNDASWQIWKTVGAPSASNAGTQVDSGVPAPLTAGAPLTVGAACANDNGGQVALQFTLDGQPVANDEDTIGAGVTGWTIGVDLEPGATPSTATFGAFEEQHAP
jgi:hypothetical protein